MKLLIIHSDFIEYSAKEKAIANAEELKEKGPFRVEDCLVVFVTAEKDDVGNEAVFDEFASEMEDFRDKLGVSRIVLYPWVHLSSKPAEPESALSIIKDLERRLLEMGFEVFRSPFGWYKSFTIKCKGHPLAESYREIHGIRKEVKKTVEKGEYVILTPDGKIVDPEDYKFSKDEGDFRILVEKEVFRLERTESRRPKYLEFCEKFGFKWETMSDVGHMRYNPPACLMFDLVSDYSWYVVRDLGYPLFTLKGSNMFDLSVSAVKQHADLFGDRLYKLKADKKELVMRYAACHQQFAAIKDWIISYKNLPFGAFEVADSYRLEQSGELLLCFRLRKLHMPDLHIFCRNMEEAIEASLKVHRKINEEMKKIGRSYVYLINTTKSFLRENKEFFLKILEEGRKPALIKFYPEGKYYWVINVEYNIIDEIGRPREIGTFQIDVGNAKRFGIKYVDEDGSYKYPIIIHTAIIGSVERYLYSIFDTIAINLKKGKVPALPLWLSPIQVRLIPVSKDFLANVEEVAEVLKNAGIRVDIDDRSESVSYRVRAAEKEWIPYIVVFGEEEASKKELQVRVREEKKIKRYTVEDLIEEIKRKTEGYPKRDINMPLKLSQRPVF
ncbi:MAG: threonine--tRNA ligase [Candidatus Asgardarchaeia archaeon]